MKDDIRDQIEALRAEVRRLSDSFVSIRDEDVRGVFARQVRSVLVERIDRSLGWPGSVENAACRSALLEWLDGCLDALERGGRAGGLRYLGRRSARSLVSDCAPGQEELAEDLEERVRSYIDVYDRVLSPPSKEGSERFAKEFVPERAEAALGPLSNATRLEVLRRLSREDDGLASLSRALGLQKGHLQFHLRSLMDGRYIEYDRKRRLYSLSPRGRRALDGLARLMEDLDGQGEK